MVMELPNGETVKTLIVLGSGGHTAEMLSLVSALDRRRFKPRVYVAAAGDTLSWQRALKAEESSIGDVASTGDGGRGGGRSDSREDSGGGGGKAGGSGSSDGGDGGIGSRDDGGSGGSEGSAMRLETIPRSRSVGQSYLTSVWTTLVAILAAVRLVFTVRPRLVLANGPGTCVPVCLAAILMKWVLWRPVHVTFVESICRVRSLSLSGQILYRLADDVIVQWPDLVKRYPRALYLGRLV